MNFSKMYTLFLKIEQWRQNWESIPEHYLKKALPWQPKTIKIIFFLHLLIEYIFLEKSPNFSQIHPAQAEILSKTS